MYFVLKFKLLNYLRVKFLRYKTYQPFKRTLTSWKVKVLHKDKIHSSWAIWIKLSKLKAVAHFSLLYFYFSWSWISWFFWSRWRVRSVIESNQKIERTGLGGVDISKLMFKIIIFICRKKMKEIFIATGQKV